MSHTALLPAEPTEAPEPLQKPSWGGRLQLLHHLESTLQRPGSWLTTWEHPQ